MRLILELQADPENSPDIVPVFETDEEMGGIIGSGTDADWILSDPRGGVSKAHAALGFIHQHFYIADTSAGGVFLNDSPAPIGAGRSEYIRSGDVLRIGSFRIGVRVEAGRAPAADAAAATIPDDWQLAFGSAAPASVPSGGLPADFDPLAVGSSSGAVPASAPLEGLPADFDPLAAETVAGAAPGPASAPSGGLPVDFDPLAAVPASGTAPVSAPAEGLPVDFDPLAPAPPEAIASAPAPGVGSAGRPAGVDFLAALAGAETASMGTMGSALAGLGDAAMTGPPVPVPVLSDSAGADVVDVAQDQVPAPFPCAMPLPGQRPGFGGAPVAPVAAPLVADVSVGDAVSERTEPAGSDVAPDSVWAVLGLERPQDPAVRAEALRVIARGFAAGADGLATVLSARAQLKDEFRLTRTQVAARENNAFKFAGSGREALDTLLPMPTPGFLPFDRAVEAGFLDIAAHEVATMVGMRAAFSGLLKRFQPENLKARFADQGKALFGRGGSEKARCWDAFVAYYADLADGADDVFNSVFSEAFERAYEEQIALLKKQGEP